MAKSSIAARIYHRAVTMTLLSMRYEVEMRALAGELLHDDEEFTEGLFACIERNEVLKNSLTKNEGILIKTPIGEWPDYLHIQYSWHIEAVGCLLWAVMAFREMPEHLEPVEIEKVDRYFGQNCHDTSMTWIDKVLNHRYNIRHESQIKQELKRAEILYQRCIMGSYIRDGKINVPTKTYEELFSLEENGWPIGPGGDIRLVSSKYQREFCDMSKEEEGHIAPMALVRVQAFRWVLNPDLLWDEMALDDLEKLPT